LREQNRTKTKFLALELSLLEEKPLLALFMG
jgi:hypothetical protein